MEKYVEAKNPIKQNLEAKNPEKQNLEAKKITIKQNTKNQKKTKFEILIPRGKRKQLGKIKRGKKRFGNILDAKKGNAK